MALVEFAVDMCRIQMEQGGGFVFEHPQSAWSWKEVSTLKEFREAEGVYELKEFRSLRRLGAKGV